MQDGSSLKLTRQSYEAGLIRKEILELHRMSDWLLGLPEEVGRKRAFLLEKWCYSS